MEYFSEMAAVYARWLYRKTMPHPFVEKERFGEKGTFFLLPAW